MTDQTVLARAQEIIAKSETAITAHDALMHALLERYPTREALAAAAATFASGMMSKLKASTYRLPEPDGLFDIPETISISTPEGVLFISKKHALTGQVRQFIREGRQHHAAQHLRFRRATEELDAIKDIPDDVPWTDARNELEAMTIGEIEP